MSSIVRRAAGSLYWRYALSGTARSVRKARLTYLARPKLRNIERCLKQINSKGVAGDCLEFGVALGGSGILLASLMGPGRCFIGYDVFGLIPPPSEKDARDAHERYQVIAEGKSQGILGDRYYGYENDLLHKVERSFREFGTPVDNHRVRLVQGRFEDTVSFDETMRIAFAHIDCEWFEPVALCLAKVYSRLSPGGIVVIDDYRDFQGCRKATDAFLERHPDIELVDTSSNAILVRRQS